jgi:hypothetical protein
MVPRPGERIGPFLLVKLLGQGGMGAVFVARHPNGAEVALKVLLEDGEGQGDQRLERFKREMTAMGRVDKHPGIVRVHTAGTYGPGLPYVVMELVRGSDLKHMIGGKPMEPLLAATIVEKVARAVHHCHEQGVIHRDLKPANILVRSEDKEPLVTDFGLARDDSADRLTRTGEVLGTPSYMAPEQLEGARDQQDRRTDVYALGAILYECLTGDVPFKGETHVQLVKQILVDDPVDPRKKAPKVPPDLAVIALKCLRKEREGRYSTAAGVADELARVRAGEPILARPETYWEVQRRRLRKRRREVALPLVGLLVVGIAAVAFVVLARRSGAREEAGSKVEACLREAEVAARAAGYPRLLDGLPAETRASFDKLAEARRALSDLGGDPVGERGGVLERWAGLCSDPEKTLAREAPRDDLLLANLDAAAAVRLMKKDARAATAVVAPATERLLAAKGKRDLPDALAKVLARSGDAVAALIDVHKAWGTLAADEAKAWRPDVEDASDTALEDLLAHGIRPSTSLPDAVAAVVSLGDPVRLARIAAAASPDAYTRLVGRAERLDDATLRNVKTVVALELFLRPASPSPAAPHPPVLAFRDLLEPLVQKAFSEQALAAEKVVRGDSFRRGAGLLEDILMLGRDQLKPETVAAFLDLFGNFVLRFDEDYVVQRIALLLFMRLSPQDPVDPNFIAFRGTNDLAITDDAKHELAKELSGAAQQILNDSAADAPTLLAALEVADWASTEYDDPKARTPERVKESARIEKAAFEAFERHWPAALARVDAENARFLRSVRAFEKAESLVRLRTEASDHVDELSPAMFERISTAIGLAEEALALNYPRLWEIHSFLADNHLALLQRLVARRRSADGEEIEKEARAVVEHCNAWEAGVARDAETAKQLNALENPSLEERLRQLQLTFLDKPRTLEKGVVVQPIRRRADADEQLVLAFEATDPAKAREGLLSQIAELEKALAIYAESEGTHFDLAFALVRRWHLDHAPADLEAASRHLDLSLRSTIDGLDTYKRGKAEELRDQIRDLLKSQK